jgi:serine/threonine protein kinase
VLSPNLPWNSTKASIALLGLADGMRYIHSLHILHRDLKPANVILDEDSYPKICDFGMGRLASAKTTQGVGTPLYMAPEAFVSDNVSYPCDVYAFGIIAYELGTGRAPWPKLLTGMVMSKVGSGERPELADDEPTPALNALIRACWDQEQTLRPTFEQIVERIIENRIVIGDCDARGAEYQRYCRRLGLDAGTRGENDDWE